MRFYFDFFCVAFANSSSMRLNGTELPCAKIRRAKWTFAQIELTKANCTNAMHLHNRVSAATVSIWCQQNLKSSETPVEMMWLIPRIVFRPKGDNGSVHKEFSSERNTAVSLVSHSLRQQAMEDSQDSSGSQHFEV